MICKQYLLLSFSVILLASGCTPISSEQKTTAPSKQKTALLVDTVIQIGEANDRIEYIKGRKDGKKQGFYRRRNAIGVLLEEANYSNGVLDGMRVLFFEQGDTQIVETYQKGMFQGPYRMYYPDGTLQAKGAYLDNKMYGVWISYYKSGGIKEEVTFSNNLENGPFREYYEDGTLQVEGAYKNGDKEHGILKFYDLNGQHVKTMDCLDGICKTVWKATH